MIVKPTGAQKQDRAHAAVGSVLDAGAKVHAAGRTAGRIGSKALLYYFCGVMLFGLMFSSIPIWFKALVGGGVFLLFRRSRRRKAGSLAALAATAVPTPPAGTP